MRHHVDVPGVGPDLLARLGAAGGGDPGVGAEDVDASAERLARRADDAGGVAGQGGGADLLGDGGGLGGVEVVDHDAGALRGESAGQGRADAAARSGHHYCRVPHGLHVRVSLDSTVPAD